MRAQLAARRYDVTPGTPLEVALEVFNPDAYIDGVAARVIGLDPAWVECNPWQLSLFPETGGQLGVRIAIPAAFPAGEHIVGLEVYSIVEPTQREMFDLILDVTEETAGELAVTPADVTAGKRGRFEVIGANTGNVALQLALSGSDPEGATVHTFDPPLLVVPPGEERRALLEVEGRRPRFGQPATRVLTVAGVDGAHELTATAMFRQRPWIPRGLLTAAILAAIIGLWAAVVLLGVRAVLGQEELTKRAPISLQLGMEDRNPASAMGTATGEVTAASNGEPLPRVTVEAFRTSTEGGQSPIGAAATDDEGSYQLAQLTPGTYRFRFSAPGYDTIWLGGAPAEAGSDTMRIGAGGAAEGVDAVMVGQPGSILGMVETGSATAPVLVTVTLRPIIDDARQAPIAATQTLGESNYTFGNLPTPGTYEISFEAPGFQPNTTEVLLTGGQDGVANTVRLSAGPGSISGTVTSALGPVGGVTVTATGGSTTVTTATPTTGAIGRYALTELPTPGTYQITFEKEGFGSATTTVELQAGEARTGVDVALVGGTGSIAGTVRDGAGQPIGDVAVQVLWGQSRAETRTLTAGQPGTYRVTGLPTPGNFTVTFGKPGYAGVTVAVTLQESGFASGIDATLVPSTSTLEGTVIDGAGAPRPGAAIVVTNGTTRLETVSTSSPSPGFFRLSGLAPGRYTITVTALGQDIYAEIVTLPPGVTSRNVQMVAAP
jgi:protocatechuate 3,4-dioxygenase beta subunit